MKSTKSTADEMLREIDEQERSNFEAVLGKALDEAQDEGYTVVLVLLDEIDKQVIYPSEQNEKSILEDVTETFRDATQSWGPMLYWGFDRIGLIQPKLDKNELKSGVQRFIRAALTKEFRAGGDTRTASLAAGVAAFPEDGETATDLIAFALKSLAKSD